MDRKFLFKEKRAIRITEALSERFGLTVDPSALVRSLSVGLKQRVEILKALAVDARILILDEPTAVLSPQEVEGFFTILRKLQADGRAIIFISHKMKEVLEISDRITVLRRGKKVYLGPTGELTARELAREMIGEDISEVKRSANAEPWHRSSRQRLSNLQSTYSAVEMNRVSDVSMESLVVNSVGIAGLTANGNRNSRKQLYGLDTTLPGHKHAGSNPKGIKAVRQRGVGYYPEDRQTYRGSFSPPFLRKNPVLNVIALATSPTGMSITKSGSEKPADNSLLIMNIRPPVADSLLHRSLGHPTEHRAIARRNLTSIPDLLYRR